VNKILNVESFVLLFLFTNGISYYVCFWNKKSLKKPKGEKWFDKLFNVKYLPLFHHFKAIDQFPKHIIVFVKIVANAPLSLLTCHRLT
jgi:hypothetical protein